MTYSGMSDQFVRSAERMRGMKAGSPPIAFQKFDIRVANATDLIAERADSRQIAIAELGKKYDNELLVNLCVSYLERMSHNRYSREMDEVRSGFAEQLLVSAVQRAPENRIPWLIRFLTDIESVVR